MESPRVLSNLTRIGIGLGILFPVMAIVIDLIYRDFGLTLSNLATLYKSNPLHWVILMAPLVLGGVFNFLGRSITAREKYLQELTALEKKQTSQLAEYIEQLGNGNLTAEISSEFGSGSLSASLASLRDGLLSEKIGAEKRQWTNEGLARFGDILRSQSNLDELGYAIISNLVKYLNCTQGGLFITQQEGEEVYLQLTGCYAYERKKFLSKRVETGQGLVGQCYLERQTIVLHKVPSNYVTITSGLGFATPSFLILTPLKTEGSVEGVIEIAGFQKLEPHEIEFLEKVAESIASVLSNVKNNEHTKRLLQSSQEQAEMMRSQEEEMRQNMEELSATQEEMERKEKEFVEKLEAYRSRFGEL